MSEFKHRSVLLGEAVNSLCVKPDGVYIDGTAGGGGHSAEILKRLESGTLLALDRDPDAINALNTRFKDCNNIKIINKRFSELAEALDQSGINKFDGLLLDIGVSSFQLDTAERGFSYHSDAPLDMRMSKSGKSAYDVVNGYSEKELSEIIFKFGEEKFAGRIASNIVKSRETSPVGTTGELVEIIKRSMPAAAKRAAHPARRTFQAIRIEVNGELQELRTALDAALERANKGARISVITFHSLEDRIVKNKFKEWAQGCTCPRDFPVCVCGKTPKAKILKAVAPCSEEIESNPRARSARLRTAIIL